MKRIQMIIYLLSFFLFTKGQNATRDYTSRYNYMVEKTYLEATSLVENSARSVNDIIYSDGFGRKWQEIQVLGSPVGNLDLVIPHEYSSFGQIEREYLPYVKEGNNGAFDANMLVPSHWNIYGAEEQNYAFTHTQYENSPLARVVQQTGPGKAWHTNGKATNIDYDMNHSEEVRLYKVSSNGVLSVGGYYQSGTLQKQIVTDEDGHKSEIFTDNNDKTILTIAVDGNEKMETYYVYDARNQLRYVLPPEATHQLGMSIDISVLEKLAYYYEYDRKGRMTVKRLPGCQLISMVYDRCDRLILSQNGKQCTENTAKWSYFIYDNQNRIIEDGEIILSFSPTHEQLQQEAWDKESYLPEGVRAPLQYTTYDNYEVSDKVTAHPFVSFSGYHDHYNLHVSGLKTRTKVKILGTNDWLTTTFYYDDHSRSIQLICDNPQGILSYINTVYDFIGNTLKKQEVYDVDTLETTYEYDDRGRLLVKNNIWNGKALDRINYEYDALGQLKSKHCGEHIIESLSYNIRGWITDIQCSSFSQTLHYTDGSGIPCYNGNISSMTWHSGSEAGLRGYKFTYDGFSRLKDAVYGEGELLSNNTNHFNEQVTGYDKNGNILGLLRYGQTNTMSYDLIDNLNLVYNGNQLESVNDNATGHVFGNGMEFKDGASREIEYEYDANGNLTKDLNKKIADIQYNCLNLPEKVQFEGGNSISYLYAADGTKLRTTYKAGNATIITDYCGNAIYENGVLVKLLTEDGYITASDNQFHYFIQDHQGNNRVVVAQNGTVEEVNDYYPFGGLLSSSLSNNVQPYKYNGKELNRDNGLDWYDYGARMYDASLGRWHVVDPMAENYYLFNPYSYCGNNPVNCIDLDGMDYWNTNNPREIACFLNALASQQTTTGFFDAFNYSSWSHSKDTEFLSGLTYNDEKNIFYSSYGVVSNGIPIIIGVSLPGIGQNNGWVSVQRLNPMRSLPTEASVSTPALPLLPVLGQTLGRMAMGSFGAFFTIITFQGDSPNQMKVVNDSGKNEKHGDGGRALEKEKDRIGELESQLNNTPNNKEREKIKLKIRRIRENGQKNRKGEEHSRGNKR